MSNGFASSSTKGLDGLEREVESRMKRMAVDPMKDKEPAEDQSKQGETMDEHTENQVPPASVSQTKGPEPLGGVPGPKENAAKAILDELTQLIEQGKPMSGADEPGDDKEFDQHQTMPQDVQSEQNFDDKVEKKLKRLAGVSPAEEVFSEQKYKGQTLTVIQEKPGVFRPYINDEAYGLSFSNGSSAERHGKELIEKGNK